MDLIFSNKPDQIIQLYYVVCSLSDHSLTLKNIVGQVQKKGTSKSII